MPEPRWIRFTLRPAGPNDRRVTRVWTITSKQYGDQLGRVAWYSGWRRYVFEPQPGTIYEQDCLRDIATFCEEQTRVRARERMAAKERVMN